METFISEPVKLCNVAAVRLNALTPPFGLSTHTQHTSPLSIYIYIYVNIYVSLYIFLSTYRRNIFVLQATHRSKSPFECAQHVHIQTWFWKIFCEYWRARHAEKRERESPFRWVFRRGRFIIPSVALLYFGPHFGEQIGLLHFPLDTRTSQRHHTWRWCIPIYDASASESIIS